jgi:hypothetical protein
LRLAERTTAMDVRRTLMLVAGALLVAPLARGGHEQSVYPSYYPHEIEIAAVGPERAAELMARGKLHAYVGRAPQFAVAPPDGIGTVESLGSFIVLKINPNAGLAKDEASTCAAAGGILREMAARGGGLIVHPYPVTPFHGDCCRGRSRPMTSRCAPRAWHEASCARTG